ncbi:MAG: UTP--glucose-1-phosphate uridylyltransferase GalU [Methanophagales archaeon ANME-1-THS]|nr:MAG: UTP--glucose-1-phosphate uridylyltransferase GalU [Methanophagales archaeon ANME-1-THS]
MIRKAVIPAAGLGTRFLPATKAQPKEMLPVVDKPVIQYVVEEAVASGIRDILIITGKGKRAIEDHFGKSERENQFLDELDELMRGVNLFYTRQREPRGLGDAVYHAKSFVGGDAFALLLGDTITIPGCTAELVKIYEEFKTSIIAVEEVPREKISSYGIIKGKEIEGDIHLVGDLVEKPRAEDAPSNLGILGRYILTPAIFEAIERTAPGQGDEIQLTDALRLVKEKIYAAVYRGRRYDIGNKLDWIKSNIELSLADERFGEEIKKFISSIR